MPKWDGQGLHPAQEIYEQLEPLFADLEMNVRVQIPTRLLSDLSRKGPVAQPNSNPADVEPHGSLATQDALYGIM